VVANSGAASAIPAGSDPSSLAFTGSDMAKTGGLGALLLLGGGALVMAAKRRKHVNASV
jgi:LPXTG-motif cell wall-anchored protein